jgi:outer membrane protein assembly factor BamA
LVKSANHVLQPVFRYAVVLALLLLAGAGTPLAAASSASNSAPAKVLQTEGNTAFSTRRLVELSAFPGAMPDWNREDWNSWAADAALLVREAYRDLGYFNVEAIVHLRFPDSTTQSGPEAVLLHVDEGPRYRFGDVRISLPSSDYPRFDSTRLQTRTGRLFDRARLFRDRRALLRFYGDKGFLHAQAAESLYFDPGLGLVDVALRVVPGNALVFDTLVFHVQREGDTTNRSGITRLKGLRELFPLERGDTLTLTQLNDYERKLKSTRVFNFLRLRDSVPESETASRGVMVLTAEERVPGELDVAGYWETQYGFGTDISWSHANLHGTLQEGRLGTTLAQRKQSVLAGYAAPLLFGTLVRFDNELVANWYQDHSLVRDTGWFDGDFDISNQSKLSRQLSAWARGVSGAELFGKSERIDTGSRVRDFNLNFLNSVYLQRLDNWINPTRGAKLALTWGNGGPLLDDGRIAVFRNRHNWLESEASGYIPLFRGTVLALRVNGGRFFGEGGINASRFFLGGSRSVRSRDWRSVCPRVTTEGICEQEDVEPAYTLASGELRVHPFYGATRGWTGKLSELQIVPFADYGNVWEPGKPLTESGQGRAVGIGLRYGFLSLFNIRIDYARDPEDASVHRWVFDLAQAF